MTDHPETPTTFQEFMDSLGNAPTDSSARQIFLDLIEEVAGICCGEDVLNPYEVVKMYTNPEESKNS